MASLTSLHITAQIYPGLAHFEAGPSIYHNQKAGPHYPLVGSITLQTNKQKLLVYLRFILTGIW